MAQIAVERRGGIPWWVWLLLALIVIAFIWYVVAAGNRDTAAVPGAKVGEASRVDTSGGLTDLSTIYNPSNAGNYVGQAVASEPVRVLSVTGDRLFWVGEDSGRQVLVALDEQRTPNQPATEGRYDVNPGQMVRIYGTVERYPGFDAARQRWNADQNLRSEFDRQTVYVHANRLDIVSRP